MIDFAVDTISNVEKIINYDLTSYFDRFRSFVSDHYPQIVSFHNGNGDQYPPEAGKELAYLIGQSDFIDNSISNLSANFSRADDVNLIVFLDDIKTRLKVISKLGKFMRSTKYDGINEIGTPVNYFVTGGETPELVSSIDSPDPQNDYVDIYVKNRIKETDYLPNEGYKIKLGMRRSIAPRIQSVVAVMDGDSVLGVDYSNEFEFVDNDIKTLSNKDTFIQAVKNLANLVKGDIPEFPDLGRTLDVGDNLGPFSIPLMAREMADTFATDDTIGEFSLIDVNRNGTSLFIEISVKSVTDQITEERIPI